MDPQLAQLLQAAAAADSSTPTFFSVGANGEPTAEFEGVISALGLTLPQGGVPLEEHSQVSWKDGEGQREIIEGFGGQAGVLRLLAKELLESGGGGNSSIDVKAPANGLPGNAGYVKATANGFTKTIVGENNTSSFLQLVSAAKRTCSFGTSAFTFPGGSQLSTPTVISHGLGVTPVISGGWTFPQTTLGCFVELLGATTTTFELRAVCAIGVPTVGQAVGVGWFALG